jgi:predicted RNA binding protein YcfA (HicA-like mRNA interferase family)
MPRKVRDLIRDYRKNGATVDVGKGKGSHRKITHPTFRGFVILSGKEGADAKGYQERDLKKFLGKVSK